MSREKSILDCWGLAGTTPSTKKRASQRMSMVQELGRLSVSGVQAKSFRNPYFLTPQLRAAKRRTAERREKSKFRIQKPGARFGTRNSEFRRSGSARRRRVWGIVGD